MLGLRMGIMNVYSMNYLRGILSSSVADLGINSSTIRLRRDSDNAELEFNSVAGVVDTVGILAWSTTDSVYVTKIFDKSGNGNHAIQTTASEQPRLINTGVFEVDDDGNYAMKCDGIDDNMVVDNKVFETGSVSFSLLAKFQKNSLMKSTICGTELITKIQAAELNNLTAFTSSNGIGWEINTDVDTYVVDTVYNYIITGNVDNNLFKGYVDGSLKKELALYTGLGSNANNFYMSTYDGLSEPLDGFISRVIIFNKALTQAEITYLTSKT